MLRFVNVFVSSPGDCSAERDVVEEVLERVNRSDSDRTGLVFRSFRWEHNVVPKLGPAPQKVIDEQTPACEIFVGIMSARFGGDRERESGTEHELREALEGFGEYGRPWVMFYFNNHPTIERKEQAALELARVFKFRAELEAKGIVGTYTGVRGSKEGFFEILEQHIRGLLRHIEGDTEPARVPSALPERSTARRRLREHPAPAARPSLFADVSPNTFVPAAAGGLVCVLFTLGARRVELDSARMVMDLLAVMTFLPVGYATGRRSPGAPKWIAVVSSVMIGAVGALAAYVGTSPQSRVEWGIVLIAFGFFGPLLAFLGQVLAGLVRRPAVDATVAPKS